MTDFVHLHLHSDRSSLDSVIKIPDLVIQVRNLGMNAVAVTDHGVASASIQLYKEARKDKNKKGEALVPIKPIIGMEAYLSPTDDHTFKEQLVNQPKQQCYHLTLLAKNAEGVKQIYELSSRGYLEGFYYKPRISLPMIEEIGKDLIILGACAKGPISWNLKEGHPEAAIIWLKRLRDMFPNRFYLELMDHGLDWQAKLNIELSNLSEEFDVPWIPTNDAHFLRREDHMIHSLMMCLQLKETLETLSMRYPENCYVRSPEEMISLFGLEACKRTVAIAEQVEIKLDLGKAFFPIFKED